MLKRAYAKINLGLQIIRKRKDGYHDIDTVFHRIGLYDELTFSKRERGIGMTCTDAALPIDTSNLCYKAAALLLKEAGYDGGVFIELAKRIPYGAGLGGGSSDAACTLLALKEMLDLQIGDAQLRILGASLGADVPYFMGQGSAHAEGIGDILHYFDLTIPYWIVLGAPPVHVSTPWAYSQCTLNPELQTVQLRQALTEHIGEPAVLMDTVRNDFEPVVFNRYEEVRHIKETLLREGAVFALMSGSGSSVFGFYRDETTAQHSAELLGKNCFTFITPPDFTLPA